LILLHDGCRIGAPVRQGTYNPLFSLDLKLKMDAKKPASSTIRNAVLVKARPVLLVATVCIAIFAFAFIAAPNSCQWGFSAYFWSGLVALGVLFAIPFIFGSARSQLSRFLLGFVFMLLGCGVWLAGAYVANMRILCRLF